MFSNFDDISLFGEILEPGSSSSDQNVFRKRQNIYISSAGAFFPMLSGYLGIDNCLEQVNDFQKVVFVHHFIEKLRQIFLHIDEIAVLFFLSSPRSF